MSCYDEQLRGLQKKVDRKRQLDAMLRELYERQRLLRRKVEELQEVMFREQADVDRLEGGSLASFFYNVVGRMDERLTKERQEAYAAKVKYDAAAAELSVLEEDIGRKEREAMSLRGCEEEYRRIFEEKAGMIRDSGSSAGRRILELERELAENENQERELQEAIAAGQQAMELCRAILDSLGRAGDWAMFDVFSDSFLADAMKYSRLDEAQRMIQQLQISLQNFRTELADVTVRADLQINISGFMQFADFFFDNIFTDWMVRDRITRSGRQVEETYGQITGVLSQLETMLRQYEWRNREISREKEKLVREYQQESPALEK